MIPVRSFNIDNFKFVYLFDLLLRNITSLTVEYSEFLFLLNISYVLQQQIHETRQQLFSLKKKTIQKYVWITVT